MNSTHFDTLIIGAGISGISAAHYMQADCPNKTYAILEGRENIGGTWDLFRYPGIRSDSDMYTFGFAFRPWTAPKAIAPRELIIEYLEDTVKEEGIDRHILFQHRVNKASWSSETATWTLSVATANSDQIQIFTCSFLAVCTGYYDFNEGYTPKFEGREDFKGRIVHPQKWTEDIDYTDKKVIVIGSGATAMTLVPALCKKAAHVTMLQRSPTYVVSQPAEDKKSTFINKYLPKKMAYSLNRWRMIQYQRITFAFSKSRPDTVKKIIIKGVKQQLPEGFDVEKHFTPSYDPWDQRICLVPNGDLFKAIRAEKASVVTDHIERFTERGILLKSGESLEADLIVTATGLNATIVSNFDIEVDGKLVDFSKKVSYKGAMLSDIPNATFTFGYTNASWTLKCDMVSQYICRLINFMDKKGYKQCCPRVNPADLDLRPFLNFTPGYVMRVLDKLPKLGTEKPWTIDEKFYNDRKLFLKSPVDDGVLEFL